MPGQAEATVQFIQHCLRMLPQLGEHDQAVEPQIGGFVDHVAAVAAHLVGGVVLAIGGPLNELGHWPAGIMVAVGVYLIVRR